MKPLLAAAMLAVLSFASPARAESPADLNDLQIAHAAYTADVIDIRYAHLALALSTNETVRGFARTMISDHEAVNAKALALLAKLGASPEDNFLSKALNDGAEAKVAELVALQGVDFDRAYAANELAYHQAVNGIVSDAFIPNIENPEMKALFVEAEVIFKMHEHHAEMMVEAVK